MNISWFLLLLIGGTLLAIILVLLWHPQRNRSQTRVLSEYERRHINTVFRNDDRYWNAGVFYNNPDDPALFVPKRFGLGWTLNFGHPQSRLVMIGALLLLLLLMALPLLVSGSAPTGCHSFGCHP